MIGALDGGLTIPFEQETRGAFPPSCTGVIGAPKGPGSEELGRDNG